MRISPWLFVLAALFFASNAGAQTPVGTDDLIGPQILADIAQIAQNSPPATQPPQTHPAAFTYSHGYEVRAEVHKYASIATLPLFATEFALGQSLYNGNDGGTKRSLHGAVGAGIVGLFGVNSVTGVWNLLEARQDPAGKSLRTTHGILMLAANAGFVAAAATAPGHERNGAPGFRNNPSTHRDIALGSIGVGAAGYLIMLLGHH